MGGFLKQAAILAGLGFSGVQADENIHLKQFNMYGSDETLQSLEPYKQAMLELADSDIFVMSASDIFDRDTILKIRAFDFMDADLSLIINVDAGLARLDEMFNEHQDILPQSVISKDNSPLDWSRAIKTAFLEKAALSSPFAYHVDDAANQNSACIILIPDNDVHPDIMMTTIAGLPSSMIPMIETDLSSENIFEIVNYHEAAHCAQPKIETNDPVDHAIARLGKEITADHSANIAFAAASANQGYNAEKILKEFQMFRAIANVRNSSTVLATPDKYLSHGNHFNGGNDHMEPEEFAQVIAAGQSVNMLTNLHIMLSMNLYHLTPETMSLGIEKQDDYLSFIATPDFIFDTAEHVRTENPLIEYATLLEIAQSKVFGYLTRPETEQERLLKGSWLTKMIDDYLAAFETVIPDAKQHPVVINQREIVAKKIQEIETALAPVLNGQTNTGLERLSYVGEDAANDQNPTCGLNTYQIRSATDLLKSVQEYRACYVKSLVQPIQPFTPPSSEMPAPEGP